MIICIDAEDAFLRIQTHIKNTGRTDQKLLKPVAHGETTGVQNGADTSMSGGQGSQCTSFSIIFIFGPCDPSTRSKSQVLDGC